MCPAIVYISTEWVKHILFPNSRLESSLMRFESFQSNLNEFRIGWNADSLYTWNLKRLKVLRKSLTSILYYYINRLAWKRKKSRIQKHIFFTKTLPKGVFTDSWNPSQNELQIASINLSIIWNVYYLFQNLKSLGASEKDICAKWGGWVPNLCIFWSLWTNHASNVSKCWTNSWRKLLCSRRKQNFIQSCFLHIFYST